MVQFTHYSHKFESSAFDSALIKMYVSSFMDQYNRNVIRKLIFSSYEPDTINYKRYYKYIVQFRHFVAQLMRSYYIRPLILYNQQAFFCSTP